MTEPFPAPSPLLIRRLGQAFVLAGLFLAIGMGAITVYMAREVTAPVLPGKSSGWTGDHALTVQMFVIFGAVILFGIVTVLNGLWTVRHGAFNPAFRVILLLIGAALLADAVFVIVTNGNT